MISITENTRGLRVSRVRARCVCVRTHGVPEVLQRYAHPGAPSPKSQRYRRPLRRPILPGVRPSVPRSGRLCVCGCESVRVCRPGVLLSVCSRSSRRRIGRFFGFLRFPLSLPLSSDPAQHPTGLFLSQTNTPRDTQGLTSLTRPYVTSSSSSSLCGCGKFRTEFFVNSPRVASFSPCGGKIRRC